MHVNVRQHHPCPRMRHHPGEHCKCAMRLDVTVPRGFSRAADSGLVHASRLQNLRWRLGGCPRAREALPLSLRILAQDFPDESIMERPVTYPKSTARGVLVGQGGKRRSVQRCRSVCFSPDLVAEVPHITHRRPDSEYHIREPMNGVSVAPDLQVNRNLARLRSNHDHVLSISRDCGCLGFLSHLWSSPTTFQASGMDSISVDTMPLAAGGVLTGAATTTSSVRRRLDFLPTPCRGRTPKGLHWSSAGRLASRNEIRQQAYEEVHSNCLTIEQLTWP